MSLFRFSRTPVTELLLKQWTKEMGGGTHLKIRTADYLLAEEQGRLRAYLCRGESKGVDKGLFHLSLFMVSETQATLDFSYTSARYPGSSEDAEAWAIAQLRAEGVTTLVNVGYTDSTEPRRDDQGLPIRPRGGAQK